MTSVKFVSQGCSANMGEAEVMAGILKKKGFDVEHSDNPGDVNIVNICTVKKDSTPINAIKKIKNANPDGKIVITGCITDSIVPKIKEIDPSISFANTHHIEKIGTVVEQAIQGEHVELISKVAESKANLPSLRKNPVVGIIPILNGCNYFCTFCSTKLVKGKLLSYPAKDIKEDLKRHVSEGCKEIWITSNDTGAYMVDQGGKQQIVSLLNDLLSVPMNFMIRVGMMNPGNSLPILNELIEVFKHPKMFRFLHIPLQAGNSKVLKDMNRQYTVEEYKQVVNAFKGEIPDLTLSTDIIVGFPGETEEEFQETVELCKELEFDVINISRYSAREGTIAAKKKQILSRDVKERSRLLTQVSSELSETNNKKWLGWKGKVLIDEKGKNETWVGRNYAYKPVIVKGDYKLGDWVTVEIKETTTFDLRDASVFLDA